MEMKEEVKTERVEKLINNSEILYRKTLAQFKLSWQIDCIITWCHGYRFLLTSNFEQSVCQKYRELKDFLQPINCSCFNESDLIIIWFAFVLLLDQRHDAKTLGEEVEKRGGDEVCSVCWKRLVLLSAFYLSILGYCLILQLTIFVFFVAENLLSKLWWNMKTRKKLEGNFKNTNKSWVRMLRNDRNLLHFYRSNFLKYRLIDWKLSCNQKLKRYCSKLRYDCSRVKS